MAYASLLSLGETLEQILHPGNKSDLLPHQTEQQLMKSLHEKVDFLLDFLDVISPKRSEEIIGFEKRIRDAAYEAEDLIESEIYSNQIRLESNQIVSGREQKCKGLHRVKEELISISQDLLQMTGTDLIEIQQRSNFLESTSWNQVASKSGSDVFVGFDDQLAEIQNQLIGEPPKLESISIYGTAGIGKTTIARMIHDDSRTAAHFDIRAWVTISQELNELEVLQHILNSIGDPNNGPRRHSMDKLAEKLYKRLKHKRFLLVMDDVWDASAVEKIKRLLPEDNNGSRILLTTRSEKVARNASPCIQPLNLRFLCMDECWHLLRDTVFREGACPLQLDALGRKIASKCAGLPLLTVWTGGLLYRGEKTRDYWMHVLINMHNLANDPVDFLPFFYSQLPHHLRACLLYMGVLPEDYAIRRSILIMLWVHNRFIKPHKSKLLEEVAEEYLQDLVDRKLIIVREWTDVGEIKTCCIHDTVRDFCLMKAKEEKLDSEAGYLPEIHNNLRHVSIRSDTIPKFHNAQNHELLLRSITFFSPNSPNDIHFVTLFWLLRILDALTLSLDEFPLELVEFVTLRYIALTFWLKHGIPALISKLCNLETLIINPGKLRTIFNATFFPPEIWKLSRLRHLFCVRGFLPYPIEALNARNQYILFENLQTLTNVVNFRWTKEALLMMPNLKKLVISYEHDGRTEWSSYCFDNFVLLHQLEVLKCFFFAKSYMKYEEPLPVKFAFPQKLKKLTLSGCRISWKDLTIVGALPYLQALKLKFHALEGSEWEPNNGEFRQLKFLLIHMTDLEHWKADETHFPSLERLTLNYCYNLVEIPSRIGKIQTLQEINLCGCSTSTMTSANVIQEEQSKFDNRGFRVILKKDEDDANILRQEWRK